MTYEKVMADHDQIARICRDLRAGLDADGAVLEEALGAFSQLSITIDTLADFELRELCPRLLAIEGDFATRAGIRFRDSVEALGEAKTFEPFFGVKQEIDLSPASPLPGAAARPEVTRSAGGGVKLESRDAYSLSLTTDVENLDAEKHAVKSQLRLNLQLK